MLMNGGLRKLEPLRAFVDRGYLAEITILIVEDDRTLRETLQFNLEKEGYKVVVAADGAEALEVFHTTAPGLIILDIMLPVISGLEVCRIVRAEKPVPVIMLTAKTAEVDRVVGLEMGADDYVTKPFAMRELLARIKAVLRRVKTEDESITRGGKGTNHLEAGNIKVDFSSHSVIRGDKQIELNPKEFELLTLLMSNIGRVLSREQILRKVWGYEYIGNDRTVDVHIRWLRSKVENDPDNPQYIITVRGYGYKFVKPPI